MREEVIEKERCSFWRATVCVQARFMPYDSYLRKHVKSGSSCTCVLWICRKHITRGDQNRVWKILKIYGVWRGGGSYFRYDEQFL